MFVDLSGFTAMSDKLSASGRLGSEELAVVINRVFDPLLEIIRDHGGDVVKFGGDAVLVLFRGIKQSANSVACAGKLLAKIGNNYKATSSVGQFPIAIHIGIKRGKALSVIVGKCGERNDHLICGPDISQSYVAADTAGPGELCICEQTLQKVPGLKTNRRGDYHIVNLSSIKSTSGNRRASIAANVRMSSLKPFIIRQIWDKITGSKTHLDGEHRPVTAVFIAIDGWYGNLSAAEKGRRGFRKLNDHICRVFSTVEKFGGNIVRLDVSEYGERALALFGAPILRENAPEDALRAALEITALSEKFSSRLNQPLRVKIGVNSGTCYVGDVGGSCRREYTAMGKDINLAARLMAKADWGEIICGPAALEACGDSFEIASKGRCILKGIVEPIELSQVMGIAEGKERWQSKIELVGRDKEIAILHTFAENCANGSPEIQRIFGEAGSGKSVLTEIALKDFRNKGIRTLISACFEYTSNIPLYPLEVILRGILDIKDSDDKQTRRTKLLDVLEAVGESEWEGLISRLAGYSVNPTAEINHLTEEAKRNRIFHLLKSILIWAFSGKQGCIILDDMHWSDATTIEFLQKYGEKLRENKIGVLLVSRPSDIVPKFESSTDIKLGLLEREASIALFNSIIGGKVPPKFVDEIVKTSGGNPFYIEEMAKAVRDMGIDSWNETLGVPDKIERVITARIDRLDEMIKTTIRTASVIGRIFGLEDLSEIFPVKHKKSRIPSYLEKSAELDITPVEKTEPVIEYGFKHILTRQVAYSGLSFKTKRDLHLALARHYRRNRIVRGIAPELIAFHFENSQRPLLAAPYYFRAGLVNSRSFSNSEAIHNYSKALEILESGNNTGLKCRAHLGLGSIYKLVGDYDNSEKHFRSAIDLSPSNRIWKREAFRKISELYRIKSEFEKAKEALDNLMTIAGDDPGIAAVYQNGLGEIARRKGDLATAGQSFRDALIMKDKIDPKLRAQILNNLGITSWMSGGLDKAFEAYEESLEIYRANRDLQGMAKISNNTGIVLEQKGDLYRAAQYYSEAGEVFQKIGDRRSQGYCYGNLATNYILRGLLNQSRNYINKALELFEEIGDKNAVVMTMGNLSDWYYLCGDFESETAHINKAFAMAAEIENLELVCENEIRFARFKPSGNRLESVAKLENALAKARESKWHELELKAEYDIALWKVLGGESDDVDDIFGRLNALKEQEPPQDILSGIESMASLLYFRTGRLENSRKSMLNAYKIAAKSDLCHRRLIILVLLENLFDFAGEKIRDRQEKLLSRILDGIQDSDIVRFKDRIKSHINAMLNAANSGKSPTNQAKQTTLVIGHSPV